MDTSRFAELSAPFGRFVIAQNLMAGLAYAERAEKAGDYDTRNCVVVQCVALAWQLGYSAGFRHDTNPKMAGFSTVAYIELPTGQVSWRLKDWEGGYDGHSTSEKWARCRAFGYLEPRTEER